MDKLDFVLAGVGGQGIVLMSDLLGDAALAAGYDVKKSDVHGMAQRGGSVVSYVRIGAHVSSPLPKMGDVEFLVALEKLEAARWASYLRPDGVAVVTDHAIFPLSVSAGASRYPSDEEVEAALRPRTERIYQVKGPEIAAGLANPRVLNVVVLGFVASLLPIPWEIWTATVERRVPPKYRDLNLRALEAGRAAAQVPQGRGRLSGEVAGK
jgi:indolepyruvate ferredoxin oxidoreductase beta subunit